VRRKPWCWLRARETTRTCSVSATALCGIPISWPRPRDPEAIGPAVEELMRWRSIVTKRDSAHHHHRRRDRRGRNSGRRSWSSCAAVGQPRKNPASQNPRRVDIVAVALRHCMRPGDYTNAGAPLAEGDARRVSCSACQRFPKVAPRRTSTMCSSGRSTSSTSEVFGGESERSKQMWRPSARATA